MSVTIVRGRVWKLGDDVDTDLLAPWASISEDWEERKRVMLPSRRDIVEGARPGDVLVAGKNFGCGSSREQAPENLRLLGIAAVVAESFGRIYFRNCVAIAFPTLACAGVTALCEEGEELEIDLGAGRVTNCTRGRELRTDPYTKDMLAVVEQGGLMKVLEGRVKRGELP